LRRGTAHDPCELSLETVECRADVEPEHFFFGSWGDDKHLIYLDTRDGSVHVAALRTATPLRTWPSFEEFLRASCEEHVASFDAEGQRIGVAQLPPEPAVEARPASRPLLTLRRDLEAQGRHVEELLESGPEVLALGDGSFVLAKPSELGELQIGYSICPGVEDLTGGEGAWRTEWLVIGTKEDLSDPLFVDLSSPELPVFTAEHGAGAWSPVEVAPSLASALGA